MRELFNNIDKNLRLHRPVLWGLKIHYLIPAILVAFLLCFIFGVAQSPSIYEDFDQGVAIAIAYVFIVVGLVFWLVHVFRFNKWKVFGQIKKGEGVLHFLLVWVLLYAMSMIPIGMDFGRYVRTSLTFDKSEIANDMNTFNLNYWRLSMANYDDIKTESFVNSGDTSDWRIKNENLKKYLKLETYPKQGSYIYESDSVVVQKYRIITYGFSSFRKVNYSAYDTKEPVESSIVFSGRKVHNILKHEGRPWYTKKEKWDIESLNKPEQNVMEFLNLRDKYFNYSFLDKQRIQAWLYLSRYASDIYQHDYEDIDTEERAWYYDALNSSQIRYQEKIDSEIDEVSEHMEEIAKYSLWPSNSTMHGWFHAMFWVSMVLCILYFIFRHVTLKTFGVSFGVGFLIAALYGITMGLLALAGMNNFDYAPYIVFFIFFGIFVLIAFQLRHAKYRSIFHGMAMNYVFVTLPSLGVIVSMFVYEIMSAPYTKSYLTNPYDRGEFAGWGEVASIALVLISVEIFHRAYLKWYALPEE